MSFDEYLAHHQRRWKPDAVHAGAGISDREGWARVTKSNPCPVCGKPDWCGVSGDGDWAICMRVSDGSAKPTRNGGHLHKVGPNHPRELPRELVKPKKAPDWTDAVTRRCQETSDKSLYVFSAELGLRDGVDSLRKLSVFRGNRAWCFPMRRASGQVVGIRMRYDGGRNYSARGGAEGLFLPSAMDVPEIVVTEGPTDTACALSMGFDALGRPSCRGSVTETARVCEGRDVVIISDRDEPDKLGRIAGIEGAESLAEVLKLWCPSVCIILPPAPHKDLRDWYLAGATADDVKDVLETADRVITNYRRKGP